MSVPPVIEIAPLTPLSTGPDHLFDDMFDVYVPALACWSGGDRDRDRRVRIDEGGERVGERVRREGHGAVRRHEI